MKSSMGALVVALVVAVVVAAVAKQTQQKGGKAAEIPKPRQPLTKNEQPMYFRLVEAFPEYVVLAQVAFSALLRANTKATRNTFSQKVADFVLCTKAFEVIAVVELDDSSHRGREEVDGLRDAILKSAGYRVLRYKTVPDTSTVRANLETLLKPTPPAPPVAK